MSATHPADLRAQDAAKQEAERKQELRREQEIADFKLLMSFPWGRRIVWRVLSEARVFRSVFDQVPTQHAFNEGGRNQGLWVLSEVTRHAPEMYDRMVKENTTP